MSAAIAITRRDLTAGELRAGAARSREAQASRRMLAIALVLEGVDRKSAAETAGWIGRRCGTGYTATMRRGSPGSRTAGRSATAAARPEPCGRTCVMAGGRPRPGGGRGGALAAAGPSRPDRGPVRVELHERTVGKYLAALGYRRLSVRPRHPKTDLAAQERFKKVSPRR